MAQRDARLHAAGYYWYRSDAERDPASSGDWTVVEIMDNGRVSIADISFEQSELTGEFVGPLEPPAWGRPRA